MFEYCSNYLWNRISGAGNPQKVADITAKAACLKHAVQGNINLVTKEEVLELVKRRTYWTN